MRSRTPKVLHDLCGRPMIAWPVAAALEAGRGQGRRRRRARAAARGPPARGRRARGPARGQRDRRRRAGRGGAPRRRRRCSSSTATCRSSPPRRSPSSRRPTSAAGAAATIATMVLDDPAGYGRVVRRERRRRRARRRDQGRRATRRAEQLAIREVNAGVYAFDGAALKDALERLTPDNAQGELYLPDVARARSTRVAAHAVDDPTLLLGVNDRADLARVRALAQAPHPPTRTCAPASRSSTRPARSIDVDVAIGADTVIEPSSFLRGATTVGERCAVGPADHAHRRDARRRGPRPHSYLVECEVRDGASVGPFAYLRPGTAAARAARRPARSSRSRTPTSARAPRSRTSATSATPTSGPDTNLGAATITANYDGRRKHRTTIGAGVRTSRRHDPRRAGHGRRRRLHRRRTRSITEDVPARRARRSRARARPTSRATPSAASEREASDTPS